MCFDRNINGNKNVKFLECDYLLVQQCVKLTLAAPVKEASVNTEKCQSRHDTQTYWLIQLLVLGNNHISC